MSNIDASLHPIRVMGELQTLRICRECGYRPEHYGPAVDRMLALLEEWEAWKLADMKALVAEREKAE